MIMSNKQEIKEEAQVSLNENDIEIYEVILPTNVAAKDESKDAMLKKLECED